uniref:Uncharacterized protein n=1 Tax=Oryza nivara TaxID=4536 RepID=A0A0E0J5I8_ORYNI
MTQEVNEVELLRTALKSAGAGAGDARDSNKTLLVPALVDAIRNKRFFLVLDDVWSERAWDKLLKAPFSHGAAGSRVLLTTRHDGVARGMQAAYPLHHVDKLNPEDAWSLLKRQVASSEMEELEIDDTLKDIGMKIIDKCDGLPLAVKVMGGLLRRMGRRRADWEQVLQDFIREGFLHGDTNDLEKLGQDCYKELIYRNLIEPDAGYADERVSSMHDVVRSFAQNLARDEALVVSFRDEITKGALKSQKFLRLFVETNHDEFGWKIIQGQKSLRTLIVIGELKINPGDSLINFSNLRTLHIQDTNCTASLVESLHQLKHLRYIFVYCSDIARLLRNIGKLKLLQHLEIMSENYVKLPDCIVKLGQLRFLNIPVTSIPRRFSRLTNLRNLFMFPAQADGDWCSLQELGPLTQLQELSLKNLENVPATSLATKARLGEKSHLSYLRLECSSRLGEDGLVEDENGVSEEEQRRTEEVLDELTPPLCLENIDIVGYFGQRLPRWMTSRAASAYERLTIVTVEDLACCTRLPDSLCQLPCLNVFQVARAPVIKRVGPEFVTMQPSSSQRRHGHAFPRLKAMNLLGMVEWEEWEWDQQLNNVPAMPALEELMVHNYKLRSLPPGLSSQAMALTSMGVPALQRLHLEDYDMEQLPRYLQQDVSPRHLQLDCSLELLTSIALGKSSPEWSKLSHVQHVKAYADQGDIERKWHVFYTRDPYSFETNIDNSSSSS